MAHSYQQECGAKTKTGKPCKAPAMTNGRCRKHGGKSLIGPAHGRYRTGAWSKLLPVRLAARQKIGMRDPRLLELRQEITLVDAFITELMDESNKLSTPGWLKQLRDCVKDVIATKYDYQLQDPHLQRLNSLVSQRTRKHEVQEEIGKMIDRRHRLVDSENKRMIQAQQMITIEQMNVLLGNVIAIISKELQDRHSMTRIAQGIRKLIETDAVEVDDADDAIRLVPENLQRAS